MGKLRGLGIAASIVALIVMLGGTARAQNTPQQQADKLFAEGRDLLMNQKNAKAACEKFEAAIALDPTATGVMLNLGLCYETLEKYATSLYWFRKAQAAAAEAQPPLVEYEDAAKRHTSELGQKVATVKIDASLAPASVSIAIDGRPVLTSEYARVEVDRDSVVEARAAGKQVFRQIVQVNGQDAGTVQVVMVDELAPTTVDAGSGRRKLSYVVGAAGVVVWGATLAYGLTVRNNYEKGKPPYDGDPDKAHDLAEKRLRWYGTGMFVAGTAAVGAAIYLYLSAPKPYREAREQRAIAPVIGPDQLGVSYAGSF